MDFVQEAAAPEGKTAKIKCVVWDLDNTLWDGILVEDGPAKLRLKPGITEIVQELDRHGVLHSIASKNNAEEALQALKQFHLADYFLCPQISWQPKSQGIQEIARQLNIGSNSLLICGRLGVRVRAGPRCLPRGATLEGRALFRTSTNTGVSRSGN